MSRAVKACVLSQVFLGCGSSAVSFPLTLGTTYDAVGVVRILPDGIQPTSEREIYFVLDALSISNGKVQGTVSMKGSSAPAHAVTGTFDQATGDLTFDPGSASITSTAAERVEQFGGNAQDILPKDGIADELSGFIQTRMGMSLRNGSFLGTQRQARRPMMPDGQKISFTAAGTGAVVAKGEAGAAEGNAGVEIFRFQLTSKDPCPPTLGKAGADGSFSINVEGMAGDVFVLRSRVAGIASDGRAYHVGR